MTDVTPRPRSRVGVVALVLAGFAAVAPLAAWIVVAVVGAIESTTFDDAVYAGFLGGMIVFFGVVALLSPVSLVAVVLGAVSLFRGQQGTRDRRDHPRCRRLARPVRPARRAG